MRISAWLIGVSGFAVLSTVVVLAFTLGKNSKDARNENPSIDVRYVDSDSTIASNNLPGIWGLANEGCASDFVIVYSADGRFANGDGREGIEGNWKIDGRNVEHNRTIKYITDDDDLNVKIIRNPSMYIYTIVRLSADELVVDSDGTKFDLIKCPNGNYTFQDGKRFKGS